jgi:secreted PhoX family phosphatase
MKEKESISRAPLSRRRFLKSAVAGGTAIAATASLTGAAAPDEDNVTGQANDPLEDVLQRYGSEFGDMRRVR